MEKIIRLIQEETSLSYKQVNAVIDLLDAGNTIPFIARYRKEMTGALDENALRFIEERLKYHRNLKQRKEEIIRLIDEQGKLTPELQSQIEAATKMVELDDIYLPYRPKRKPVPAPPGPEGCNLLPIIYGHSRLQEILCRKPLPI